MITSIRPVDNLIQNPTMHYKLSVGELGPDNPAKASDSIGRVTIHELVNYLSMKRRAIENGEHVIFHSIEIHLTKAGSFIAAESGKTTVFTEKDKKKEKITDIQGKNDKDSDKNSINDLDNDKDGKEGKKIGKKKNDKNKINRAITNLENMLSFYKEKLQTDPQNQFYKMKVQELKGKLLALKLSKLQREMTNMTTSLVKTNIDNYASNLSNGEIIDAIA